MAELIERNGARFYSRAAEIFKDDASINEFLNELSSWEKEHEATFRSMKEKLAGSSAMPTFMGPEDEVLAYLRALADGRVFDVRVDPSEKLKGDESIEDILHTAIGLEKDSIVFYIGMKKLVPDRLGRDQLDDIIKEEMRHISILSDKLGSFKG